MKALSLARPWPALILHHGQDVVSRTWRAKHRGPLLVHALSSWDPSARAFAEVQVGVQVPGALSDTPTGVVGVVDLHDVCDGGVGMPAVRACSCGPWAVPGRYHWQLSRPRPLVPIPCQGADLGLWTPPADVLDAVARQVGTRPTPAPMPPYADLADLPAVAADIAARLRAAGYTDRPDLRQVIALAEEAGEFAGAARRYFGMGRRSGTFDEMAMELADVVITAFLAAVELGVDLPAAVAGKLATIYTRGWREDPDAREEGADG